MSLAILLSLNTMESLHNPLQPHSGAAPLFSMREVWPATSQHWRWRAVELGPKKSIIRLVSLYLFASVYLLHSTSFLPDRTFGLSGSGFKSWLHMCGKSEINSTHIPHPVPMCGKSEINSTRIPHPVPMCDYEWNKLDLHPTPCTYVWLWVK